MKTAASISGPSGATHAVITPALTCVPGPRMENKIFTRKNWVECSRTNALSDESMDYPHRRHPSPGGLLQGTSRYLEVLVGINESHLCPAIGPQRQLSASQQSSTFGKSRKTVQDGAYAARAIHSGLRFLRVQDPQNPTVLIFRVLHVKSCLTPP